MNDERNELVYGAAQQLLEEGKYKEAIEELQQLPADYQDVSALIQQAKNELVYEHAKQHLENKQFKEALQQLQQLPVNYKDIPALIRQAEEGSKRSWFMPVMLGVVAVVFLAGLSAFFIFKPSTPTPTAIVQITDTPLLPPTSASDTPLPPTTASSPTIPPTSESASPTPPPTTEPTIEPTDTPTEEVATTPTQEPTTQPTQELTAEPTATPTQESEPLTGKIAVPVFEKAPNKVDNTYNLYIASADNGWQPTLLFEQASQPAFTKDGIGIALRSWEHPDWGQQLIYLSNFSDITKYRKMTDFVEDTHPSLNDENVIIFHSRQQDSTKDPIIIKIGTEPGSTQTKLGEGTNPDWVGNQIIFYKSFPKAGLYMINESGGDERFILATSKTVPSAAPEGDKVAVSLEKNGHWQIFIFSASQGEGNLIQLTSTPEADNYLPAWSPDGKYIAFASKRDNQWAIWVMNIDGTSQRKLFDLPGSIDGKISDPKINSNLSFGLWEERLSWAP